MVMVMVMLFRFPLSARWPEPSRGRTALRVVMISSLSDVGLRRDHQIKDLAPGQPGPTCADALAGFPCCPTVVVGDGAMRLHPA